MVLIPKKPGAVDVDAFRPICLQNCSLKILSKILTSRLQKEIPNLIDIRQTGFIKGRSISDTFVHAAELVQVCHKRKKPAVVLKLDFAKAFDTVNWDGLFRVLQARGFSDLWITCRRGLWQGDPISPYLFLLVAETLQCLIRNCSGVQHPTNDGLPCEVLQYADDTLIVLKGDLQGVSLLKQIIDQFAGLSGLHINYEKSTLVPIHLDEQTISNCVQAIGCRREGFPQPYLWLPLSVHKLQLSAYTPLHQEN
jgi:hypothetical protein